MGQKPLQVTPADLVLAEALSAHLERDGISSRALESATGVNRMRITRILNGERPATFSEVTLICEAIGIPASQLMQEVEALEEERSRKADVIAFPGTPTEGMTDAEVASLMRSQPQRNAALNPGYAPEDEYDQ